MQTTLRFGCGHALMYPDPVATMRDPMEQNCPACLGLICPSLIADSWRRGEISRWNKTATEPIFHVPDEGKKP